MPHGKIVDLVQRSDLIVIGRTEPPRPGGGPFQNAAIRVDRVLVGVPPASPFTFHSRARFAPGRYVFFLHNTPSGIEGMQEAGTIFPATPEDDSAYTRTIQALHRVVHAGPPEREAAALRAALIPALSDGAPELRYHAGMELSALAQDGYPPTDAERRNLSRMLSDPGTDPALRPILSSLLAGKK
jgi:hypothetical protein